MTTLPEIRAIVRASTPDYWERLETGPFYLYRLATVTTFPDGKETVHLEHEEHVSRAVFRPDIALGLAWGMPVDDEPRTSDRFADPKVYLRFVDVLWHGALVDRRVVQEVDGGRCVLPVGRPVLVDSEAARFGLEVVGTTVTAYDRDLARLLDSFRGVSEFDRYFERADLVVELTERDD